jgi:hypothetical protein
MTPSDLVRLLPPGAWPSPEEPAALLGAIERACDAAPRDLALLRALDAAHGCATAGDGLPAAIAGVRREVLVRWDAFSSTWDGTGLHDGRPVRVRTLRAHAVRDPITRRRITREGAALRALFPQLDATDGTWPALTMPLEGGALLAAEAGEPDRRVATRLVGAVAALEQAEARGLAFPLLSADELRDGEAGVTIACLTIGGAAPRDQLRRLAFALGEVVAPLDRVVGGIAEFPPDTYREAAVLVRKALRDELTSTLHGLRRRATRAAHESRMMRLHEQVIALDRALPPPDGRGAVGVDLDGNTTIVACDGGRLAWGPVDGPLTDVHVPGEGLKPLVARRLLRARAAAPPNTRLQAAVGGDPAFVDATCRWVSGALALRTIRLLIEARRT